MTSTSRARILRAAPYFLPGHVSAGLRPRSDQPEREAGWHLGCLRRVEALDPLVEELEQRGATFVYPPVVQPYGMREFAVRDPSGYVLGFGEEWPVRTAAPEAQTAEARGGF